MRIVSLQVRDYRTLENLDLSFHDSYTAICGRNDSGKTNVIKAIRGFVREDEDQYFIRGPEQVSVKDDYPKWKEVQQQQRSIEISICLTADQDGDAGLYQAIVKQLQIKAPQQLLQFTICTTYVHDKAEPAVKVVHGAQEYSGIDAQEVLKRVQSSRSVLFHNSTSPENPYRIRGGVGQLRELSGETGHILGTMKKSVDKGLKKITKGQQQEIEQLLGRLENKYRVGLSLPAFDLSWMPLNITLGEKKFGVPLDEWGSGTQNRTLILMTLFRAKQISDSEASASKITPLIVVEEPECFLHPLAQAEFGRVLQDLANEFKVQVIVTTHSPYMLSLTSSASNVLLDRRSHYSQLRETVRVDSTGDKWMAPFGQVLGLSADEFKPWRNLFFSSSESILLVEGETDKEYFELLRNDAHGSGALNFEGEIISYDGIGSLANSVLLRFIKNRYKRVFVTYDLDVEAPIEKTLKGLGFEKGQSYIGIGASTAGKRNIEGLVPDAIRGSVYSAHANLVMAATSGTHDEQKSAKSQLKKLIREEFSKVARPGDDFKSFYAVAKLVNKALRPPQS